MESCPSKPVCFFVCFFFLETVDAPVDRPAYRGYTGGVLSVWRAQFETINGFSNEFWGWGGEDDDFYNRLKHKGYDVLRDLSRSAGFFSLPHPWSRANPRR